MNQLSPPRFHVTFPPDGPRVEVAEPEARRRRSKPIYVSKPSGLVRTYPATTRFVSKGKRRKYKSFVLLWRDANGRQRERRALLEDARARADEIDRNLGNGNTAMTSFGQDARASHLRCLELAAPLKQPPELIIAKYVELVKLLEGADPEQAARFYLQNRPKDFRRLAIPDLVTQFLADKEGKISKDYYAHLSKQLELFSQHFAAEDKQTTPPLHLLGSADLNTWLRGLKNRSGHSLGARARHNYRSAVDTLVRWSQANGYLPATWAEMKRVADPGTRIARVKIWGPAEHNKLLTALEEAEQSGKSRKHSLIPFVAMQSFAGVRHAELARRDIETKKRLDWRDVHLSERWIYISPEVSKTGVPRTIPICDTLAVWLGPYARTAGPVCELANVSASLTRAKKAAHLPAGKNCSRNILRHSWVSYRLVKLKHIGAVAEEAGNSPGIIRKHYREVLPPGFDAGAAAPTSDGKSWPLEADADAWFARRPKQLDPLFDWARDKNGTIVPFPMAKVS